MRSYSSKSARNSKSLTKIVFKITNQGFFTQILQRIQQQFPNIVVEILPKVFIFQIPSTKLSENSLEIVLRLLE